MKLPTIYLVAWGEQDDADVVEAWTTEGEALTRCRALAWEFSKTILDRYEFRIEHTTNDPRKVKVMVRRLDDIQGWRLAREYEVREMAVQSEAITRLGSLAE